jgi:hypothetical protein
LALSPSTLQNTYAPWKGVYLEYNEAMEPRLVIPLILGWIGGWIVNYLADVLPVTRRFSQPACPHCNTAYTWQDYLFFRRDRSSISGRSQRLHLELAPGAFGIRAGTVHPAVLYDGFRD